MSFEAIRASAESKLETWGGLPIAYDNVQFDSTSYDSWVKVVILDGDSFPASISDTCKVRRTGLVGVGITTEQWIGSSIARQYADQISALFSNTRDGSIIYQTAYVNRVGHAEDVYRLNVYIPFIYSEV